ncbi:MAG TPA: hypothetical protein VJ939_05195, partial [Bacteroidales bacterium]|nr:hypothetical protein [Bacteroidales bacterium]
EESAKSLKEKYDIYQKYDVFPKPLLDDLIEKLKSFEDKNIREEIDQEPEKLIKLMEKYFHV